MFAERDSTAIFLGAQIMTLNMLSRKASNRYKFRGYPYRKPTQVVGERILRCSSESWLRN